VSIFYFFNSFSLIFSFLLVIFSLHFFVALTHDAANSGPSGELGQGPDAAISGQGRCRTGSARPGVRSGRRERAWGRGRRASGGAGEVGAARVRARSGRCRRGRGCAGAGDLGAALASAGRARASSEWLRQARPRGGADEILPGRRRQAPARRRGRAGELHQRRATGGRRWRGRVGGC
jgi:hypothetical protein